MGVARLNSIRGHQCTRADCGPDLINQTQSSGLVLGSGGSGIDILENRIADNDVGIIQLASPDCCRISENYLSNNLIGIGIQDGNGTTSENEISRGQIGIVVAADSVDTVGVLRGDKISGTSVAPVREFACCGFKATAIIKKD